MTTILRLCYESTTYIFVRLLWFYAFVNNNRMKRILSLTLQNMKINSAFKANTAPNILMNWVFQWIKKVCQFYKIFIAFISIIFRIIYVIWIRCNACVVYINLARWNKITWCLLSRSIWNNFIWFWNVC